MYYSLCFDTGGIGEKLWQGVPVMVGRVLLVRTPVALFFLGAVRSIFTGEKLYGWDGGEIRLMATA